MTHHGGVSERFEVEDIPDDDTTRARGFLLRHHSRHKHVDRAREKKGGAVHDGNLRKEDGRMAHFGLEIEDYLSDGIKRRTNHIYESFKEHIYFVLQVHGRGIARFFEGLITIAHKSGKVSCAYLVQGAREMGRKDQSHCKVKILSIDPLTLPQLLLFL